MNQSLSIRSVPSLPWASLTLPDIFAVPGAPYYIVNDFGAIFSYIWSLLHFSWPQPNAAELQFFFWRVQFSNWSTLANTASK